MDYLKQLLLGLLQDQQGSHWFMLVLVFVTIFILVFALMSLFDYFSDPVRVRFKNISNNVVLLPLESDDFSERLRKHHLLYVPVNQSLLQRTVTRLHYAGYHSRDSLFHYYAVKMIFTILLPILVFIIMMLIPGIESQYLLRGVLIALGVGYLAPSFILDKLIKRRQKVLQRSFPDALDMIVICSEAGLSLDSAIQKVAADLGISHPELADELNLVIAETRAGVERHVALKRVVERTGVEDIRGLVSTLVQSMRFGTSIADAIRLFSEELRDKRIQAAEEMAAKIALKLIFPLGVCLLPAFLMVVLGPAIILFQTM